jgi:hypothetical protein
VTIEEGRNDEVATTCGDGRGRLAVLGACGGNDGGSKKALIAKGDALCAENRDKQRPVEESTGIGPLFASGGVPTLAQWRALFEGIRPMNADMFARFRALEPPKQDRARFDRWVAAERDIDAKMGAVVTDEQARLRRLHACQLAARGCPPQPSCATRHSNDVHRS